MTTLHHAALLLATLLFGGLAPAHAQTPPLVISSDNHSGGVIWAGDRAGAPANNGTVNLMPVDAGGAQQSANVNSTGSSLQINSSTVAQPTAVLRQNNIFCNAAAQTWSAASTCSGNIPRTIAGGSAVATDATGPATGSATYSCQVDGNWSAPTGVSCTATCGATTGSWSGSASCSGPLAAATTGQYVGVTSNNGNTGTAQFLCSAAGTWSLATNGGCSAPAPKAFVWVSCCTEFKSNYKETFYFVDLEATQPTTAPPTYEGSGPIADGPYFRYMKGRFGGMGWFYVASATFSYRIGAFQFQNCSYAVRVLYGTPTGALICDKIQLY